MCAQDCASTCGGTGCLFQSWTSKGGAAHHGEDAGVAVSTGCHLELILRWECFLKIPAKQQQSTKKSLRKETMKNKNMGLSRVATKVFSFTSLIKAYGQSERLSEARSVLEEMWSKKVVPNQSLGHSRAISTFTRARVQRSVGFGR